MMNDEWWMPNDQWWMLNDGWWMMNDDGWCMINDEWRMTNDERWMIESLNWFISQKERLNSSQPSCVTESTELVHITRGKTELIPSWLCNRKHSSSSKCSTEKSHQFISKVSQKLDYCVSTHTHTNSIPTSLCNRQHWIGSRRCYIESQQTEPFPIWTENSTLLHRKR